ncbi:MAG: gliding motility protein GldN [Prevotellaceae bacterium]|jgi:gliding motility associated protien GldN|nr:gliding motility protein GldN [Prevotellaceae bacterium]
MKAINRILLPLMVVFALGASAFAQSSTTDDFFNEYGEIPANLPTSYDMKELTPIEYQSPRADDIYWQKVVYRVLDLREKMNYPLYYPEEPSNNGRALFSEIFTLIKDKKVPAFKFEFADEKFTKANAIDFEEDILKKFEIIYKAQVDPTTKVRTFEVEEADIPNREVIKYFMKEVWFFDRNSSTFTVKIIAICPVLVTDRGVGIQNFPICWIPYDNLRPYFVQHEILITDKNNGARMSFDDLFIKRRFASNIYKESNIQNRMILDYNGTQEDVKREQQRIKTDIINMEQDLWEY